jgi:hypothetical protein
LAYCHGKLFLTPFSSQGAKALRVFVRSVLVFLLLWCSVGVAFGQYWKFGQEWTRKIVLSDEVWLQDSIPQKARERVVIAYPKLQACSVVALFNSPYEATRRQLHEEVQKAFGVESQNEIIRKISTGSSFNPHVPSAPLFGDAFNDFHALGIADIESHEYRIETKPYNTEVRWWESSSISQWRLIDGMPLFGKPVSILVVSRIDYSREWARMHPGIPLPFTIMVQTELVTNREVTVLDTVREKLRQPEVEYFIPYPGYITDGVLTVMMAIRDTVRQLPEATLSP